MDFNWSLMFPVSSYTIHPLNFTKTMEIGLFHVCSSIRSKLCDIRED